MSKSVKGIVSIIISLTLILSLSVCLTGSVSADPDGPGQATLGDLNGDGSITAGDALLVLQISVNNINPTDSQKTAADVNLDQKIDAADALLILQYSVRIISEFPKDDGGSRSIVIYFSCTGRTENAANRIAELSNSDIYKIIPAVPYTSEDLNYGNDNCRANVEQHDPSARPEISGQLPDLSGYDRVYIGFPIWWGTCPKIINTFLETCDLSGKTVYPFCTSGGSGISTAQDYIESVCANADVKPGIRANGASDTALSEWIAG